MSSQDDKHEPSRFLGEGVSFKAKLIGILEVSEARGDRMCQEALADLKMAIRAAGEHKQRITINIAIDGLRLRDEKTGDSLYHHPVHKISFIAQDMSDSRAFGYIFGSPDTGHRFFGIKTDKAASQVVIAMRDLFQVVFELKKKEIELAKQHIEQKSRFGTNTTASLFSDTAISNTKSYTNGDSHNTSSKLTSVSESTSKTQSSSGEGATARPTTTSESAIADLVDLELELSSIQQGIHQMERITPSDPFGPNKDDPFSSDPFGDSFTSFPQKPFLPPPPSARDRPRNASASDTTSGGSLFSPKTPKTGGSADIGGQDLFKNSHDDQSCGWFTPTGGTDSLFEDAISSTAVPISESATPAKESETTSAKESNASILSQFDVFTELDPLGTGRSKPYIDKKLFFQELKNPPKKVLKDLVTETQPTEGNLFNANFETNTHNTTITTTTTTTFTNNNLSTTNALFQTDPFADGDPFDKTDPFAEDDFSKAQDPFDTDFVGDFKLFNKQELKPINKSDSTTSDHSEKFKFPSLQTDKLQPLFPSSLSKSPNRSSVFEKQMSMSSVSPRNSSSTLAKQNTFDVKFDSDKKSFSKLSQLHENPSLDMSSESESAPEPPPRPATNITPIKPPPLPPKKQPGDIAVKPPPRPPHNEESHYDYMESYETGLNSLDGFDSLEQTPPLPVPARKSRFDNSDFGLAPQRPKKQFHSQSSDDDYLTPVAPPLLPPQKKDNFRNVSKDSSGPILLPPPMKKDSSKRSERLTNQSQVTVASYLESKPKITSTTATDKLNLTPDTLDITLSQLTLSGLNELANKLNIPASQLSNMTLVQLTSYLSNYVRTNNTTLPVSTTETSSSNDATFPTFKADFSANFNDLNNSTTKTEPYDRYAVFRELLDQEEFNKTNESTTSQEKEETPKMEEPPVVTPQTEEQQELPEEKKENIELKPTFEESNTADKYAALREIIIEDNVISEVKESNLETMEEVNESETDKENEEEKQQNDLNLESLKIKDESDINDKLNREVESNIIEYENSLEPKKENLKSPTPTKSPTLIKSPIPIAITEIIQTSNHLTSGSVSDVISGSSPEVDNVGSTSETVTKKNVENTTRESWAIFDTPHHRRDTNKEKQVQSEEGVSPWSSDSKEFGNGSPSDWQQRRDSGSEGDWARRRRDRDGTWWDNQEEIGGHYDKPSRVVYTRERRSTDSYDDEWYEPDRPRRRTRQQSSHTSWNKPGGGGGGTGGQSSSSRDVSPWEEEEPRSRRDREECWPPNRRSRGPSRDRERHRRRDDSWDEEDDYEYEDEYMKKFQWTDRHGSRESDRGSRDSDRHSGPRDPDHWDSGGDQWPEERRHERRRRHPQDDRWCRPDWDHDGDMVCGAKEKMRYGRWPNQENKWRGDRERKRDSDRYYKRDHSQESPWEDDYSNDPDEPHSPRYLTARRNWKRPASASEMDRKSGEIKSRQPYYMGTGGSDGERDRKYRTNRRSRSRDSQFSEMSHQRHKPDTSLTLGRYSHRNRDKMYSQKFENDFSPQEMPKGKLDVKLDPNKKSATLGRKKAKDLPSPKIENENLPGKGVRKQHLMFENDFVNSENDSPVVAKTKFNFENEFETSEVDSPITRYSKSPRSNSENEHFQTKHNLRPVSKSAGFENEFVKEHSKSPVGNIKQKSLFEDDFSPTEKTTPNIEDNGITVIAEETVSEPRVSFTENNLDRTTSEVRKHNKHILAKNRIANNMRGDGHIKKSESVNIFARENDPFDDDFFSGKDNVEVQKVENTKISPNTVTEFKWTEDFDSFDIPEEK